MSKKKDRIQRECNIAADLIDGVLEHLERAATLIDAEETRCDCQDEQFPYSYSGLNVRAWCDTMQAYAGRVRLLANETTKEIEQ